MKKQTFLVYGMSLYSMINGKSRKYRAYDTEALVRSHQWGLLNRQPVCVPTFRDGNAFIIMKTEDKYELEINGEAFVLYRSVIDSMGYNWGSRQLLASGNLDPECRVDNKDNDRITWYGIGDDKWEYSFHCHLPVKKARRVRSKG